MEQRSVGKFIVLSLVTLGIYTIVWFFWTAKELRNLGHDVPTAWLQFIPLANIYFYYKHFDASEKATNGGVNSVLYLVLGIFVSVIISAALAQTEYNKMAAAGAAPMPGGMPGGGPAPGMPGQPMPPAAPAAPVDPNMQAPAAPAAPAPGADVAAPAPQDPNQQPPAAPPAA